MTFNSSQFLIFFPFVTLLYFIFPQRLRWVWLLVASYYFYMSWNPRYALLIAASTLITYACGRMLARIQRTAPAQATLYKRGCLLLGLVSNLGILFFFKYWDFFRENMVQLGGWLQLTITLPSFDILLPVGISFYTFQALGYLIDVYRGEIEAERNVLRYALFVSFFPQLVAGPIERSKNLLTQIHQPHFFKPEQVRDGLLLMLWGFFMKLVIADRLALLVNQVYDDYASLSGSAILLATILFAVQIYCDFNGYSSIAIGAAQVLDFKLMENFRQPYLATSCADFWHRWHISLSSWLRDYVYIPLGGNRCSRRRKYFNIMMTFLASGLWHGAQWHYVLWGLMHGLFQIVGELLKGARHRFLSALHIAPGGRLHTLGSMLLTFVLIDVAWLFFRAPSCTDAFAMLQRLFTHFDLGALFSTNAEGVLQLYTLGLEAPQFWVGMLAIGVLMVVDCVRESTDIRPLLVRLPLVPRWVLYYLGIFVLLIFGIYGPGFDASSFIYFQF